MDKLELSLLRVFIGLVLTAAYLSSVSPVWASEKNGSFSAAITKSEELEHLVDQCIGFLQLNPEIEEYPGDSICQLMEVNIEKYRNFQKVFRLTHDEIEYIEQYQLLDPIAVRIFQKMEIVHKVKKVIRDRESSKIELDEKKANDEKIFRQLSDLSLTVLNSNSYTEAISKDMWVRSHRITLDWNKIFMQRARNAKAYDVVEDLKVENQKLEATIYELSSEPIFSINGYNKIVRITPDVIDFVIEIKNYSDDKIRCDIRAEFTQKDNSKETDTRKSEINPMQTTEVYRSNDVLAGTHYEVNCSW